MLALWVGLSPCRLSSTSPFQPPHLHRAPAAHQPLAPVVSWSLRAVAEVTALPCPFPPCPLLCRSLPPTLLSQHPVVLSQGAPLCSESSTPAPCQPAHSVQPSRGRGGGQIQLPLFLLPVALELHEVGRRGYGSGEAAGGGGKSCWWSRPWSPKAPFQSEALSSPAFPLAVFVTSPRVGSSWPSSTCRGVDMGALETQGPFLIFSRTAPPHHAALALLLPTSSVYVGTHSPSTPRGSPAGSGGLGAGWL